MGVRHGILALLQREPVHGYELKRQFEASTGGMWPLNVGQVYSTLGRLERDGLVEAEDAAAHHNRQRWRITRSGTEVLREWYPEVIDDQPLRDELVAKVLLALNNRAIDIRPVLQAQRIAAVKRMQTYTQKKRKLEPKSDLIQLLLLDSLILKADAEIKWLDLCEARLKDRAAGESGAKG